MKKKINFFDLLKEQSECAFRSSKLLKDYCSSLDESVADAVISLEEEADGVRRDLIDGLNKTYITPIDREDLFHLSLLLDEIIDYIKTAVDEMRLFKIVQNEDIGKMTDTLQEITEHLHTAISEMSHDQEKSSEAAYRVKHLENVMDSLTKTAYAKIFENDDFKMIFKYAEIYKHLNHTADVADRSMDFLLDIFVKL